MVRYVICKLVSKKFEYYFQKFEHQSPVWTSLTDNWKKLNERDAEDIIMVLNKEFPNGYYYAKKIVV